MRTRRVAAKMFLVPLAGLLLAVTAGPALAGTGPWPVAYSWSGNDHTHNESDAKQLWLCDGEGDGHWVYTNYTRDSGAGYYENHNGNGSCVGSFSNYLLQCHQVVEDVPWSRDDYGSYECIR